MFCMNCGTEFNESQAFCPNCKESVTQKISGTRRPTIINVNNSSNGSIGTGVFVGSIILFFIGWVPIIGGLIAGGIGTILIILSIGQTILCAIGGLIGGSLRN